MATALTLASLQTGGMEPQYRTAPHNIEAEQALLGAMLVNNDAFYRVSDFLEAEHFSEDVHRRIYDVARSLIRTGKIATPITLKTFLGDQDLGGMTVSHYLARLAAEATTVINAEDYGRTIYDLAMRRQLITIGEDLVNVAYDAPVDEPPRKQIEDAERRLYELAEKGRYEGGFQSFSEALRGAIDMAAEAFKRDRKLSGISTGILDLDRMMGGLQALRPRRSSPAARPWARPRSPPTSPSTSPSPTSANASPTARSSGWMAASSASSRSKCRPSSSRPASSPSNRASRPTRSAAARSASRISRESPTPPARWSASPSTSTRPAASPLPSSPRAPGASSARRASMSW